MKNSWRGNKRIKSADPRTVLNDGLSDNTQSAPRQVAGSAPQFIERINPGHILVKRMIEMGISKYSIAKRMNPPVSWQTVHAWSRDFYKPSFHRLKDIEDIYFTECQKRDVSPFCSTSQMDFFRYKEGKSL